MTKTERIDRTLAGKEVDRTPISFWYHFGVQHEGGERIAELSLAFLRHYDLDWLKLMHDYFYPMPKGALELSTVDDLSKIDRFDIALSDWNEQLKAIDIIARELSGNTYFIDTIFDPWQVLLRNLVGEHLGELVEARPQAVLDALEIVSDNIISYCKAAFKLGCNGIFMSTFGSKKQMPLDRYLKFAKPFALKVFEAVKTLGNMNTVHVHDEGIYVDNVLDFPVPIISYEDRHPSNPSMPEMRRKFSGTIMGGLDKNKATRVTPAEAARNGLEGIAQGGGTRLLLAPGCSFPTWLYPGAAHALVDAVKATAKK
ncbi:MAG TPA: uroporphyrinogen decarboxylase family protein [Spirochaetia bacterium]|nr:uroporphyrinogen decarboxylase family protein [Spirochaetia bacterium]